MLSYCRQGFTDVYADLRFVLSAGTHCPGNYYSAIAAALRRPLIPPPPASVPALSEAWPLLKFRILYTSRKILACFLRSKLKIGEIGFKIWKN